MDKNEVIKHSAVIQVEHKVSLLGQQLFNVLLANAFHELATQRTHKITVQEILKYIPSAGNVTHLRKVLKSMCTPVEYNVLGKDKKNVWGFFALLPEANIPEGDNVCSYSFTDTMIDLMSDPSVYAKISLLIQKQYRGGKYGWSLYELCFDYKNIGKTPKISILELKKFFGIEDNSYSQFKEFNKWVIKPAVKEINKQTDLTIKIETYRIKRRVSKIQFLITEKKDFQPALPSPTELDREELQKLPEKQRSVLKRLEILGVSRQYAKQALKDFSPESVETAIEALEEIEKNKGLNYPNNALKAALKDVWKSKKRRRIVARKEEARKEKRRLDDIETQKKIEERLKERRRQEENYRFAALNDEEKFGLLLTGLYMRRFDSLDAQGKEDFKQEVYNEILTEHSRDLDKSVEAARKALAKAEEEMEAREEAEKIRLKKEERERKDREVREYAGMSDEDKFRRVLESLDRDSAQIFRDLNEEDGRRLKEEAFKVIFTESGDFQTALPVFCGLVRKIQQDRDREEGMAKIREILLKKSKNSD